MRRRKTADPSRGAIFSRARYRSSLKRVPTIGACWRMHAGRAFTAANPVLVVNALLPKRSGWCGEPGCFSRRCGGRAYFPLASSSGCHRGSRGILLDAGACWILVILLLAMCSDHDAERRHEQHGDCQREPLHARRSWPYGRRLAFSPCSASRSSRARWRPSQPTSLIFIRDRPGLPAPGRPRPAEKRLATATGLL